MSKNGYYIIFEGVADGIKNFFETFTKIVDIEKKVYR